MPEKIDPAIFTFFPSGSDYDVPVADQKELNVLRRGVEAWNNWRIERPHVNSGE